MICRWFAIGLVCSLISPLGPLLNAAETKPQWDLRDVPASWKSLAGGAYGKREYYAWYRCGVEIPKRWAGEKLSLVVEGVDDAREVFVNGQSIGLLGTFPPEYRSGLGATLRFPIDAKLVLAGQVNVVAIRVYQNEGRGNFNVAAPVIFGADQAIRLQGKWEATGGDDLQWGKLSARESMSEVARFAKLEDARQVEESLKKLTGDDGPLAITETIKRISHPEDLVLDVVAGEPHVRQPLSIKWDERGRLWVAQYLQYPSPAGLKMVSRDKYLRTVYDKVPPPPPHHFVGADKITIHEDTDADGIYDRHKTFVEGLNLATSFAIGRGGVFVLNPPYLLFYPDKNGDDVPDGDPEVLLEGFGLEDSHSIANSLRWGPDGWLYSTQGSTVTGQIRNYGSKDAPVHSMGQLVWRYHPETKRYEIFAEGGGNSFGVEIDRKGRVYSGHNGGDTRGFHYVQGGYFRKGFGKHGSLSNPFAYGYFEDMKHHKVERFSHTFVIYEGGAFTPKYDGKLFGVGPIQGHVVYSELDDDRSSFQTSDLGHVFTSKDSWVRPVDIQVGPDGALYVADLYEQRIDHASHYQGRIHRESGRVYRLRAPGADAVRVGDLKQASTAELIALLRHKNKWYRQTALRLFADRRDADAIAPLKQMLAASTGQDALEAFWALNLSGGFNEALAAETLTHEDPYVRQWTVRLLCDDGSVSEQTGRRLLQLAERELNVRVRSQLASSARRLPARLGLPLVGVLLRHTADVDDIHIPLLLWWAIEAKAEAHRDEVVALFTDLTLWDQPIVKQHILQRLMRRYASTGKRADLLVGAKLLELAPDKTHRDALLAGFEEAFQGRSLAGLPGELMAVLTRVGGGSRELRLRQGDQEAIQEALGRVADGQVAAAERVNLIRVLGEVRNATALPVILSVLNGEKEDALQAAALAALQSFDRPEVGGQIIEALPKLSPEVRTIAHSTLASRKTWSRALVQAVEQSRVPADSIALSAVRKLLLHGDPQLTQAVNKHWGSVEGASTAQMIAEAQRIAGLIKRGSGNPYHGKVLFKNRCGKCHRLFEDGGQIGPNLTSYKRDDLKRVLANVVNPSLEIREGYETFLVVTDDGQVVTGFIEDQDNQVVVLKQADGQKVILERDAIEDLRASKRSIMPADLLKDLSEQDLRDLFAYFRASQPLP